MFSTEKLALALQTKWLGRRIRHFASIDSTNSAGLRLPEEQAVHGLILLSEEQTSGRGRMGRQWLAPSGEGLLFSVVLQADSHRASARHHHNNNGSGLTYAAALAVYRALKRLNIQGCEIRWPNDVTIHEQKVCGILIERGPWKQTVWVLGIGLNVNQQQEAFGKEIGQPATSLRLEHGAPFERETVLALLAFELEQTLETLASGENGVESLRQAWEQASCSIGRTLAIDTGTEIIEGMAVGLDASGGLILRLPTGFMRTIHTGSVIKSKMQ